MLEYADPDERAVELTRLLGIEDKVWVQVGDFAKVYAIADEDMDRENDVKTSAVHFMRSELSVAMVVELKAGASLQMGIDHANYPLPAITVTPQVSQSLMADLDDVSIN